MDDSYIDDQLAFLPYTVASFLTRLVTDEGIDPGPNRLRFILETAEAIARLLGIIGLSECRKAMEGTDATPKIKLSPNFKRDLRSPSFGKWIMFGREACRWQQANKSFSVIKEATDFFFESGKPSRHSTSLEDLCTIRNGLSHGKIKTMHANDFFSLCARTEPLLESVLNGISFLQSYELIFMNQIEVTRKRRYTPRYKHKLSRLKGESPIFKGGRLVMEGDFMDSSSVLLRHREDGRFLNLDPLLMYEAEAGHAQDLFYYNGRKSKKAEYIACHHGGDFLEERREIIAELDLFEELFHS